jgi:Uncharacterised nucleotidyltransferase
MPIEPQPHEGVLCYDVGGLKIRPLSHASSITADIGSSFSLSSCYTQDYDVTLKGVVHKDDDYLKAMPVFIRERLDEAAGRDPLFFKGPKEEMVVLARGDKGSSYSYSRPPYNHMALCCQQFSDRPAPLLFQAVLLPMISEMLVRKGRLLMHAGCVSTPEGEGILLIADSGGGKTTTTLTMATFGFHFLSDDLVVASAGETGLVFEPIREKMNLTRKTIDFFPHTAYLREALEKSPEKKLPVAPADVFTPRQIADNARACAIFLLRVAGKKPALTRVSTQAMMAPMLKNSNFARQDTLSKEKVDLLWQLLDQADCFRLETGLKPQVLGNWICKEAASGSFCAPSPGLGSLENTGASYPQKKISHRAKTRFRPWSYSGLKLFLKGLLAFTLEDRLEATGYMTHFFSRVNRKKIQHWLRYHRIENHVAAYAAAQSLPMEEYPMLGETFLMQARASALQLAGVAGRICRQLQSEDIPAMLLRGPAMAEAYFPDTMLRYCRDVDIIVHPEDMERAESVVHQLGFQPLENRDYWLKKGELPMTDGRVVVELHWEVYPALTPMPVPEAEVWNRTSTVLLDDVPVVMAAPEHLLLSSCVHMACEHWMDRMVRLIDIRQILHHSGSDMDWDWILQKTLEAHMRFPVGHVLTMARDLVDASVPTEILQGLDPQNLTEKAALWVISPRRFLMQPGGVGGLRRAIYKRFVRRLVV